MLPGIAKDLFMPLDLVEAVHKFYWRTTRKALADIPKLSVHLPNLGDFELKTWKLEDELAEVEGKLVSISKRENPNEHHLKALNEKKDMLERLIAIKTAEDQRKEFIKKHKEERTQNVETIIEANLEQ